MSHNAKVFVGISGGVDSSVAAYLLKEQGYDVEGVFMKNWEGDDEDGYCAAEQDLADAEAVCRRLGIPLHSVNFAKEYWDRVFSHFLLEYKAGRTPNPDILCNKEIKFNAFLNYAMNSGADLIATGHYVKKGQGIEGATLLKGNDRNKDQSYFLYAIAQEALAKSLFPVGELAKEKVREIAKEQRLITHDKKDSTGICFIGERKFKNFLSEFLLAQPGVIESAEGEVIGEHQGLMYYTYGQRQGLGIGGLKQADDAPWFVVDKDIQRNALIVGQGANHPLLFSQGLICDQADWISGHTPEMPLQCTAKTRYRQLDQHCLVQQQDNGTFCVMFSSPQRAITPGQSVVFYHLNRCLGGAIIQDFIP